MGAEDISISSNRTEEDRLLSRHRERSQTIAPVLENIAVILEELVRLNFVESGRPEA